VIVALIVVNGIFAGAEIAIVSLRKSQLQQMVDEGRPGATALWKLRGQPEWFLATVQVGITVVGTAAAALGGSNVAGYLEPLLARVPLFAPKAEEIALGVVVVSISYLSLVLGELVPKSLALRANQTYALIAARPLLFLLWLAKPIVWFLTVSSNLVLKPFRDRTNFIEARVSKEEIQQMVEEAGETGEVHAQVSELATRALAFDTLTLRDLMVPRDRIDALPLAATADDVRQALLEHGHSRIPIYDGTLDNIVGYVSAKDIVALAWEGGLIVLRDLLRPVKIFPETVSAIDVLRFMRRERQRLVIAVDEHGVVSGLVAFEDVVEEIVGEVFTEHDDGPLPVTPVKDGSYVVRGDVSLRDLNRQLGIELSGPDGLTTVAGLCAHLAAGIPHRGARLAAEGGVVMVVLEATARAVKRVRVILPPPPSREPQVPTPRPGDVQAQSASP
jgi:putative hemolysin